MAKTLSEKIADYVKMHLHHEASGHDWYHVERVWKMARRIQATEGGESEIIEIAALVHNLGDLKEHEFNEEKAKLALFGMLDILEIDEEIKKRVTKLVAEIKYQGVETQVPTTLEGKIVQDANFLDTLGAIGIARSFAAGGVVGRPMHDPKIKPRKKMTKFDYRYKKREGTSINNLYEKALKIAEILNTPTARAIAAPRVKVIETFIEQFMREWNSEDIK